MRFPRREFIAMAPAGLLVAAATRRATADEFADLASESDWRRVRRQFSMADDLVYFNAGGLGPVPKIALDKVCDTIHELQHHTEHGHKLIEDARPLMARYLGVEPSEVAFTRNATEANSTIASGLRLRECEEVIIDSHAHQGGSVCWMTRARYDGVCVRCFNPVCEEPQTIVDRIAARITAKTRVIQVSHVTAPTGIKMPVREIARLAADHGIWFHIDGAQALGMFPFSPREIGCDSYASSGHKWLCGPTGTGVLYVQQERLDEVQPTDVGAYSNSKWTIPTDLDYVPTTRRFECGTRDASTVVGLAESIGLLERIGMKRVAARGLELAAHVRARLEAIDGVEVLSPMHEALRSAMVTFRFRELPANDVFGHLRRAGLRCRPVREAGLNGTRVSTHLYNSREEVDRLAEAVSGLDRI